MKTLLLVAVAVSVTSVWADGGTAYCVGYGSFATNHVDKGETEVQTAPVNAGDGDLYKTGEGTWSVPSSLLTMCGHPIHVTEGKVAVTSGGTAPTIAEPAVIRERASMWLSTKEGERKMLTSGTDPVYVEKWFDVRETNTTTPTKKFAKAVKSYNNKTYKAPEMSTCAGNHPSVYFGGYGSGRTMQWRTAADGDFGGLDVRHVFVVTCTTKRMGPLFGCTVSAGTYDVPYFPQNYSDKGAKSGYWSGSRAPTLATRLYRNGEEIVATSTYPTLNAIEVLDIDLNVARFGLDAFFAERFNVDVPRQGGDHILEAIVFERPLTQDQRVSIEAYLMSKWGVRPSTLNFDVAAGAGVTVADEVAAQGAGLVRKQGSDEWTVPNMAGRCSADAATLAVDGGSVRLNGRQPLAVEGGKTLTASATMRSNGGYVVAVADSSKPGLFEKFGTEEVLVERVDPSVQRIRVNEGRLVVAPVAKRTGAGALPLEIPLKNPSFEKGAGASGCTAQTTGGWTWEGWTLGVQDFATPVCEFAICSNRKYYASGNAVATKDRAPDGDCFGVLRGKMTIAQDVVLPEDGIYELTFWICGRWDTTQRKAPLGIYLIDKATSQQVAFAEALQTRENEFVPYGVSFQVKAGTYTLKFGNIATGDRSFSIDDFHLRKTADAADARFLIPGGNFESVTYPNNNSVEYVVENVQPGWTLEQTATGQRDVVIATAGCTYIGGLHTNCAGNDNPLFPARRMPKGGTAAVAFLADGTLRTTFTPPKGVWRLQANCTPYCMKSADSCASALQATLTPQGGAAIDLGTLSDFTQYASRDYRWNSFEADGETPMTLEVTFRAKGLGEMTVDDFELVRAEGLSDVNLVKDGGFESLGGALNVGGNILAHWDLYTALDGTVPVKAGDSVNQVGGRLYATTANYWASETYEGTSFLALWNRNNVRQEIAFPRGGRYRLTLSLAAMGQTYESLYPYMKDYDRFLMALVKPDGTETNWMMQTTVCATNFVERSYDFVIPEACTRTLVLGNPKGADGASWGWEWGACVDGVSIREVAEPEKPCIPESVWLDFADQGRLYLGFSGTNTLSKITVGGKRVKGVLNASTHPDLISGPGSLYGLPSTNGVCVIVR